MGRSPNVYLFFTVIVTVQIAQFQRKLTGGRTARLLSSESSLLAWILVRGGYGTGNVV